MAVRSHTAYRQAPTRNRLVKQRAARVVKPPALPPSIAICSGWARPLLIKAWAAATDNVGVFFGEDIFLAIGSILLIKGLLEQYGILLEPLQLSVWAIPTAIAALLIHGFRLWRLDRRLNAQGAKEAEHTA